MKSYIEIEIKKLLCINCIIQSRNRRTSMDIFFTKIDSEIETETQRDPLGEEKIWTYYCK